MKSSTLFPTLTALAVLAVPGFASPVLIANPSFETPTLSEPFNFGITSWTCTATCITIMATDAGIFSSAPDGTQVAALGEAGGAGNSAMSQTLSATLLANTLYTLTFFVGNPADNAAYNYSGYTVILSANGVTLATDTNAVSPAAGQFVKDTLTFNSGASPAELGQSLTITLNDDFHVGAAAFAVDFDNVQLDATTSSGASAPEPGAWAMVAAGLGLLGIAKRKLRG